VAPRLWKRFRHPWETSIFCLFFSACWRHNANGRSQNALPFLQHKENAVCYVTAIVTNIALRWRSDAFFTHASFHTVQSYVAYRCQQCHYLAELPAKDACFQQSHAAKRPLLYRNLKWTFEDSLPCNYYAIKTNSRTISSQVSQPASTGKWADMRGLQLITA